MDTDLSQGKGSSRNKHKKVEISHISRLIPGGRGREQTREAGQSTALVRLAL